MDRSTPSLPMPRVERGGKVLIPSAWQLLADAVLRDPDAGAAARELARAVLDAAVP